MNILARISISVWMVFTGQGQILKYAKHHNSRITKFFTLDPPSDITVKISSVNIKGMQFQEFTTSSICFPCRQIKHGYDDKQRDQINWIQDFRLVHRIMSDEEKRRRHAEFMCSAISNAFAVTLTIVVVVIVIFSKIMTPSLENSP